MEFLSYEVTQRASDSHWLLRLLDNQGQCVMVKAYSPGEDGYAEACTYGETWREKGAELPFLHRES